MDRGIIARRYAKALFRYAREQGVEKDIYDRVVELDESYRRYPALKRILSNPILPEAKKEELICLCAGGDVGEAFRRFIRLLIRQKREELLRIICLIYQELYLEERKILRVDLVTAVPMEKELERQIIGKLEGLTRETVHLRTRVDPAIIGGYVVRWDTYRLDTSVATRLREIKNSLMGISNQY